MKKKIIIIIGIVLLLIGILLITLTLLKKEKKTVDIGTFNVEVYDEVDVKDLIKDDVDITIKTDKVGEKVYTYETEEEIRTFTIKVVDNTPPYIGIGDHYNHLIGTNFTFSEDIICKDNYDKKIECNIEGEYDINTLGETDLKVLATDSSGNKTEKDFKLIVIEKSSIKDEHTRISFEQANSNKPEGTTIMIDVSKWQKEIDWKKVKKSGVDYAMIRLGTQKAINGESVIDAYFEQNIKGAHEAGVKVGVYYFSYAHSVSDATTQAKWVVEQLKDYEIELPVSFDWECWSYFNAFDMNLHDINEMAVAFMKYIEDNGYKAMNYGSKSKLVDIWEPNDYPVWLAHYTDKTTYEGEYFAWQFTDSGQIDGVNSDVDLNYLNVKFVEEK